jgi:methionyl-tRNA formyltransferase
MGTPEFAATILRRLLAPDSPVEVVAVVTQPDKPVGRKRVLTPPPVKKLAEAHAVPVLQPVSRRALLRPATVAALRRFQPDVGVVAAYGRILPPEILSIPTKGYLNVHASVLPRWRGAWPVGAAILAGDQETGVSIMLLDEGMDTGPVLAVRREPIRPDDTAASLEARLAALGADLLVETLPAYLSGEIVPQSQDDGEATYCHVVRSEAGAIDWRRPAGELERHVRAMQPWPVAFTTWNGKRLNVWHAHVVPAAASSASVPASPGTVVPVGKGAAVVTGDGLLALDQVQLEGRGSVPIAAFLNGYRTFAGSRLGVE